MARGIAWRCVTPRPSGQGMHAPRKKFVIEPGTAPVILTELQTLPVEHCAFDWHSCVSPILHATAPPHVAPLPPPASVPAICSAPCKQLAFGMRTASEAATQQGAPLHWFGEKQPQATPLHPVIVHDAA